MTYPILKAARYRRKLPCKIESSGYIIFISDNANLVLGETWDNVMYNKIYINFSVNVVNDLIKTYDDI